MKTKNKICCRWNSLLRSISVIFLLISCQSQDSNELELSNPERLRETPMLAELRSRGIPDEMIEARSGYYIIDGDMFVSTAGQIDEDPTSRTEQPYATSGLVNYF